ncbi:MAG: hypothetical protein R3F59_09290 [Myxococcota bacterium]
MTLLLALAACRSAHDDKLAEQPLEEAPFVAAFPPDGALHLWGDVPVEIILGAAADPSTLQVSQLIDGAKVPLPCGLQFDGTVATCGVIPGVEPGDALGFSVTLDGHSGRMLSDGRLPQPGIGWDLLQGVSLAALGGGETAVNTVGPYLDKAQAFAALDGYDGTDGDWTFVASPSGRRDDGTIGIAPWGFGFLLPVTVAAGTVHGEADTAWLPTQVGEDPVLLLLLDGTLDAGLSGEALTDLVLEATLPAVSLEALSDAVGLLGPQLLDLIDLDVDLDGDGTPEGATIRLAGTPAPAVLGAW